MKRGALLALTLLAAPAAAQLVKFEKQFEGRPPAPPPAVRQTAETVLNDDSDAGNLAGRVLVMTVLAPFLPYVYAVDQGDQPLKRTPYSPETQETLQRVDVFSQRVSNDVKGFGARYSLETEEGLGLTGSWTSYRERGTGEDLHHFDASAFADVWRGEKATGRYALGLGGLSGRLTRVGPRLSLGGEWAPWKPLFLEASSAVTVLEGGALGDLRVAAGVCVWRLQPWIGYRWLVGPLADLSGPEIGLSARF